MSVERYIKNVSDYTFVETNSCELSSFRTILINQPTKNVCHNLPQSMTVQHNAGLLASEAFKICHKTSNCKQCPASFSDTQTGTF